MNILIDHQWKDGFLDQKLLNQTVRIKTLAWFNLNKINDMYFIPEKSWRLVLNYIREIGIKAVLRKIISRLNESARNEKYLSIGIGVIVDSHSTLFKKNDQVIFAALCHSQCMERIVLSEKLVLHSEVFPKIENLHDDSILYADMTRTAAANNKLYSYRGWSEYSGIDLPALSKQLLSCFTLIKNEIKNVATQQLPVISQTTVKEKINCAKQKPQKKLRAGLFGYGQYAKTIILPSIKKWVDIATLHEIDATQLPTKMQRKISYDSSPIMRGDENYDMCFIAGYHHTHAGLAINSLKSGIAAIIEKPIATTKHDLDELIKAMKISNAPLFSCFHKRYLPFNQFIYQDLGIQYKQPISYHCVVFEVPLPELHWYRWPNSGSRLLSNGCHWIDYFLFLNDFSPVEKFSLQTAKNGDLAVFLELENSAVFTMTLTEMGSSRLGIREHIELRAGKNTIVITDGCHYTAENSSKILRKINVKRLSVYQTMYQKIVERIIQKTPGDSVISVQRSTSTILLLEDMYQNLNSTPRDFVSQQEPELAL